MFIPQLAASGLGLLAQIPAIINQKRTSMLQAEDAKKLDEAARNVKKRDIRKEYKEVSEDARLLAQSGMPTYGAAKANIDANSANALRSIREASPYGGVTADAISAVLGNQNKELVNLDATQGEFKLRNRQNAMQELKGIGAEEERLVQEQLAEKREIMANAKALREASTANKQIALENIGSTVAGLGTSLGKGISAGADIKTMKDDLSSGKLTQSEFEAKRRNALFGTNATGNSWMSSVANMGKSGNVDSNVGAQLGSIASSSTTPQATGGKTVTKDEFINLAKKLVDEGKAKTISEGYDLLWNDGYKY